MNKMKPKKKKSSLPQPYAAIRDYLEKKGWKVIVIRGTRVRQDFGDLKFNFHFECDFTGSKKQHGT